jgi:hypothetical protein
MEQALRSNVDSIFSRACLTWFLNDLYEVLAEAAYGESRRALDELGICDFHHTRQNRMGTLHHLEEVAGGPSAAGAVSIPIRLMEPSPSVHHDRSWDDVGRMTLQALKVLERGGTRARFRKVTDHTEL